MKEQELYRYWERKADEEISLQTNRGESVRVIGSGKRNTGSGPDYVGCILDVEGEIWTGDVEIHVDEEDWMKHGHHLDTSFDDVELHFFLHPASRSIAEDQVRRTVEVDSTGLDKPKDRYCPSEGSDSLTLCPAGNKLQSNPQRVSSALEVIERVGWERIQRRKQRVRSRWAPNRRLQTFCRLLGSSLGLHKNREPADELVEALNLRWLRTSLQGIDDPTESQRFAEGVLLARSGLLFNNRPACTGSESSGEWVTYKEQVHELIPEVNIMKSGAAWNLSDVRPVNTPFRRLAGFAALFRRFFVRFSIDQVEAFLVNRIGNIQERKRENNSYHALDLIGTLILKPAQVSTYWNEHCQPDQALSQPMALIGAHRAAVLWINGIFPYLLVLAEERNRNELQADLRELMHHASLPLGDQRTRRVKHQLFGSGAEGVRHTGVVDQGMHELFRSYCRYGPGGCSRCPVQDRLE